MIDEFTGDYILNGYVLSVFKAALWGKHRIHAMHAKQYWQDVNVLIRGSKFIRERRHSASAPPRQDTFLSSNARPHQPQDRTILDVHQQHETILSNAIKNS